MGKYRILKILVVVSFLSFLFSLIFRNEIRVPLFRVFSEELSYIICIFEEDVERLKQEGKIAELNLKAN